MIRFLLPGGDEENDSRELLLDEEGAQVGQLPGAGGAQDDELDGHPADDAGVGGLGLVSEFGFSFLSGERERVTLSMSKHLQGGELIYIDVPAGRSARA